MRKIIIVLLVLIVLVVITINFVKICDFIPGVFTRGTPQTCDCKGVKFTVENSLQTDGNYHTICVGLTFPK